MVFVKLIFIYSICGIHSFSLLDSLKISVWLYYREKGSIIMKIKKIALLCVAIIAVLILIAHHKYTHTFTSEKWKTQSVDRSLMIDDLLKNQKIIGKTESEIVEMLGESEKEREGMFSAKIKNREYDLENSLVYYIGEDVMDFRWLIIILSNSVCVDYEVNVT